VVLVEHLLLPLVLSTLVVMELHLMLVLHHQLIQFMLLVLLVLAAVVVGEQQLLVLLALVPGLQHNQVL
jgi:hypothetical protein